MNDLLSSIAIVVLLCLLLGVIQRRFDSWERSLLWGSLWAHCLAALAQVIIVTKVYGGGDMMAYRRVGNMVAAFLGEYPVEGTFMMLQVLFQQPDVPVPVPLHPSATGSMQAVSGFVMVLVGGSIYGACFLFAGVTYFSRIAVYRVFRRELQPEFHRVALYGCLWVPSVIFWSSSLLKESVAVTGLGLAIYGGHAFASGRRRIVGALLLSVGVVSAALVKAYILVPFGLAAGAWFYLDGPRPAALRRLRQIRPGPFILGVGLAVAFVLGIGELFPRFDPAGLADEAADLQGMAERTGGGSDYRIGNAADRSFLGQLSFAPLALLTALFRPTLLDVHNPMSAVNALESTAVTVLAFMAVSRSGVAGFIRGLHRSPMLAFCAVYTLGLALGVGLSTTNLGTLSRYRMPMMPFFVTMIAVLASRQCRLLVQPLRPSGFRAVGSP